jgi:hypothetical protein
VVRVAARDNGGDPIKPINLTARLNRIKLYWGNPYLTLTSIWYSGMLDMAKNIKAQKDALDREDWTLINERFGFYGNWTVTKQRLMQAMEEL